MSSDSVPSLLDLLHAEHEAELLAALGIAGASVLNIYVYGSHTYGTATATSDVDFVIIASDEVCIGGDGDPTSPPTIIANATALYNSICMREVRLGEYLHFEVPKHFDVHLYSKRAFCALLEDEYDLQALECVCLPSEYKIVEREPIAIPHPVDLIKLRHSISALVAHAKVKAKKKIIKEENEMHLGKKNLFHSLRSLDFGLQIATHGRIVNFSACQDVFRAILTDNDEDVLQQFGSAEQRETLLQEERVREAIWNKYDQRYRKQFNTQLSAFRKLAPKV